MKKHNFKTMVILFIATLLLVTGCGANNTADNNNAGNNNASGNNTSTQGTTLTEADARQIALEKAGLETATFTKQKYDANDVEYEFEFHTQDKEYDCDVNAIDGSVRNYSVEKREILD